MTTCTGTGNGSGGNANESYGFHSCKYLTTCVGSGATYAFFNCRVGFGNRKTGGNSGYSTCYTTIGGGTNWAETYQGGYNTP